MSSKKRTKYNIDMSFRDQDTLGHFDLESTELYIRSSMQSLGCVFTQTTFDENGYPVRDEASISPLISFLALSDKRGLAGVSIISRAF